jgi:hypothetical protein
MHKHADFFSYVSDHFQQTYWVPGNHVRRGGYNSDLADRCGSFKEKIRDNIFLVNNTTAIHDNVEFIFSTLWSKISPAYVWHIEHGMSDFHVIRYQGKRFSAEVFNQKHEESDAFVEQALQDKSAEKSIVVSHHIPTFLHYPEQYKGSLLSDAFATELYDLIETGGPDYWIFGYHHSNVPDFKIGTTNMLTNQLGYVKYGEHGLFDIGKTIRL